MNHPSHPCSQQRGPSTSNLEDLIGPARQLLDAQALMLDPEVVVLRARALAADTASTEAMLPLAIRSVRAGLARDRVGLRLGSLSSEQWAGVEASIGCLGEVLGLPPSRALLALARFNQLPELARRAFFILESTQQVPTPEALAAWLGSAKPEHVLLDPATIRGWLRASIHALFGREESTP